ncbi:competence transcription factor [Gracilibacillus oryzae]|uniref:Competence transcription factor n=1 Tax=Gracilibacillus oryzae TaxID=1672701 RepID=A0A7C8L9R0_9BACI|nr:competence protein ComK [Gracilibacillus oryzae]KAB8139197.1 competence transcription factor [Gracilibacillus oryzae]
MIMAKGCEISPATLAVIGMKKGENYVTKIMEYEQEDDYEVGLHSYKVMDMTCREFGISLRGLLEGSRRLTDTSHKPPIVIDRMSNMYFFPVESPLKKSCIWISHTHVKRTERLSNYQTKIIFKNDRSLNVDVSYSVILNQINKTAQYRCMISDKMSDILPLSQYIAETNKKRRLP